MVKQSPSVLLLIASSLLFLVSSMEDTRVEGASSRISLWPTRHVTITNDLGEGVVLKVHCKSKDDDLGIHDLSFHSSTQWKFRSNVFLRITLFYCYMWWGNNGYGHLDAYEATRDDDKCSDCRWSIRNDGAYWFDPDTRKWSRLYPWSKA